MSKSLDYGPSKGMHLDFPSGLQQGQIVQITERNKGALKGQQDGQWPLGSYRIDSMDNKSGEVILSKDVTGGLDELRFNVRAKPEDLLEIIGRE